jgi:hypothetical protein
MIRGLQVRTNLEPAPVLEEAWNCGVLSETKGGGAERGRSFLMIKRRDFLKLAGSGAVSTLAVGLSCGKRWASERSPTGPLANFIVILIDDMGYGGIGPFGSQLNRVLPAGLKDL